MMDSMTHTKKPVERRPARYVPKGGYLVDFEKRITPKMRWYMRQSGHHSDAASKEMEMHSGRTRAPRHDKDKDMGGSQCVTIHDRNNIHVIKKEFKATEAVAHEEKSIVLWKQHFNGEHTKHHGVPLTQAVVPDHGTVAGISHHACLKSSIPIITSPESSRGLVEAWDSQPMKTPSENGYHDHQGGQQSVVIETGTDVCETIEPKNKQGRWKKLQRKIVHYAGLSQDNVNANNIARAHWRPPGAGTSFLTKRSMHQQKKRNNNQDDSARHHHDCNTCDCCTHLRRELEDSISHYKESQKLYDKRKISLEAAQAKLNKAKKAFEDYREHEKSLLQKESDELKRKRDRDKLAQAAHLRSGSRSCEAKLLQQLEETQEQVTKEREKAKLLTERHKLEAQRLQDRQHELEQQVKDLKSKLMDSQNEIFQLMEKCESSKGRRSNDSEAVQTPHTKGQKYARMDPQNSPEHSEDASQDARSLQSCVKTIHANGTVEYAWEDGRRKLEYSNGDVKQEGVSGMVEYYYADVNCWNVSHPSGEEIYYFSEGRREAHLKDGTIQVLIEGHLSAYVCTSNGQAPSEKLPLSKLNVYLLYPCPQEIQVT